MVLRKYLVWIALGLVAAATATIAADNQAGTLDSAIQKLGADHITSIEYSGSGEWYQFGQEPNPNLPPPEYDVSSYIATIDYVNAAKRVQMTSKQTVDPGRLRFPPHNHRAPMSLWRAMPPGSSAGPEVQRPDFR